jgi:hypothetical protein
VRNTFFDQTRHGAKLRKPLVQQTPHLRIVQLSVELH